MYRYECECGESFIESVFFQGDIISEPATLSCSHCGATKYKLVSKNKPKSASAINNLCDFIMFALIVFNLMAWGYTSNADYGLMAWLVLISLKINLLWKK